MLIALRFVQGLAGAGGIVIARAVVRDMRSGAAASRLFSSLMLVTGLGPILAPVIGGQLLALTSWEGIFLLLTVLSGLLALLVVVALPETLPVERRSTDGLARTVRTMGNLLRDRAFLGYALAGGLTFGALFAYISGSPFVLQRIYGLSPQLFSLAFAMNGLGLIAASQVNAHIVERFGPKRLMIGALAAPLVGVAGPDSAVPMGVVMVTLAIGALVAYQSAGRRHPWRVAR
jgi:DHA1 family bicyclomycin/chloramphenicol resistance-like MFS transporter